LSCDVVPQLTEVAGGKLICHAPTATVSASVVFEAVALVPVAVTMMLAVPGAFTVTTPCVDTDATDGALLAYVRLTRASLTES
jgi:hypothetical protein